ncbi:helix-turn-helix domain-containing protein [Cellulomonas oligotrophica]|uniref:DNA-binding CsgD family transcriptional regulator n=1 Tax=Cellulomonas oligotrophica TaxID=931536 RepID=A0A7Y9FF54_9CELL|nr:helix-turn-helix transcriptional regulator [Cellulomonas oligotrophica]NYD86184.1 DNA-binding CsgD family transcriptional regulator [Cellulomonas oligotrophica]GIG34303.1 hypothetical protein Col01nite_34620 [Cellulomonas oligotrophica]
MGADQRRTTVVALPGSIAAAAVSAGLGSGGWDVLDVRTERVDPRSLHGPCVVVVEDDDGVARLVVPPGVPLHRTVALGTVRSADVLRHLHERGAAVLNQGAPLVPLLRLVDRRLRSPAGPPVGGELGRRHQEVLDLDRLTPAEHAVLRAMVAGLPAARIAERRHLSLHTVRSHIKSVLAKLQVTSQLEAVAVAHRSLPAAWLALAAVTFTSSGEDASARPGEQ